MKLEWTKVRAAMWSGRDGEMMYTIRQSGGPKFYVTRAIERSPFATTRSLALAKPGRKMTQPNTLKSARRRRVKFHSGVPLDSRCWLGTISNQKGAGYGPMWH